MAGPRAQPKSASKVTPKSGKKAVTPKQKAPVDKSPTEKLKTGTKRAAEEDVEAPPSKRGRGRPPTKTQQTIEDTMDIDEVENEVEDEVEVVPSAKRGRGRPKAQKTIEKTMDIAEPEPVVSANKGRGRPKVPKAVEADEDVEEQSVLISSAKKTRGRPKAQKDTEPKDKIPEESELAPSAKKARGRPKAQKVTEPEEEAAEEPEPVPSVKRGRGRPAKAQPKAEPATNGVADDVEVTEESTAEAPSQKGRGRSKQIKTPKKDVDTVMADAEEEAAEPSAKKTRGRPAKAKKVPSKEVIDGTEDPAQEPVKHDKVAVAKACGRPAKKQKTPKKTIEEPMSDCERVEEDVSDGEKEVVTTAKKGRDKTPKQKTPLETVEQATADAEDDQNANEPEMDAEDGDSYSRRGRSTSVQENVPAENEALKELSVNVDEIEDDNAIAEQINSTGDAPAESDGQKQTNGHIDNHDQSNGLQNGGKNAFDKVKADVADVKSAAQKEQNNAAEKINENNHSIIEDDQRAAMVPSSILEKGIVYFFFRPRVNVDKPQGVEDVARSYIILRPLPLGSKLGEGPIEDSGNARLLALPKKTLPKSKKDRFLVFVENEKASIKDLREQFEGSEYATKTVGTSTQPSAAPFAEGIYAITTTGRESHIAYHITRPATLGDVQIELGLHSKGSFVASVKNPKAPGQPAYASLDDPAQYPDEIQKMFRDLRWAPLEPAHLDYQHTQLLIIGEGFGDTDAAAKKLSKDERDDEKESPENELQKLEEEDHDRVEHLKQDDPVFADLGLSSKEFEQMHTTW